MIVCASIWNKENKPKISISFNTQRQQKKLLTKTAKDMGYTNIVTFVDDGVSGVTMDRPGFNETQSWLLSTRKLTRKPQSFFTSFPAKR